MCRVLSYLGKRLLLEELLYKPDNSLVTQSYNPKFMTHMLNLAGFGFMAWDHQSVDPERPFQFRTQTLPFYDENLKNLSQKLMSDCMIAHVRGIEYSEKNIVSNQNVHPFHFDNTPIVFAHNGSLTGFNDIKIDLFHYMKPEYQQRIRGTTDSEAMYALFLSRLHSDHESLTVPDLFTAVLEALDIMQTVRKRHGVKISSPLNFFISNGHYIVASRFVFDYGHFIDISSPHSLYHSLWYTCGSEYGSLNGVYQMKSSSQMHSIIISSEPLTEDSTTWIEVPEYSLIGASIVDKSIVINSLDILI